MRHEEANLVMQGHPAEEKAELPLFIMYVWRICYVPGTLC